MCGAGVRVLLDTEAKLLQDRVVTLLKDIDYQGCFVDQKLTQLTVAVRTNAMTTTVKRSHITNLRPALLLRVWMIAERN
jgi:5S rRNA maturation endonuclease (ribonuclease M5)